jgi:hypothetical protein
LVSFRPTEAGVPDRDSSSSSSDSTARDLRLGTESILTTYVGERQSACLLVRSPETRVWWALGRDTRLPSGGLETNVRCLFARLLFMGKEFARTPSYYCHQRVISQLETFKLSRKCQLRAYFIQQHLQTAFRFAINSFPRRNTGGNTSLHYTKT